MELYLLQGVKMLALCHEKLTGVKDLLGRKEVDDIEITFKLKNGAVVHVPFAFLKLPQHEIVESTRIYIDEAIVRLEKEIKNL